MDGTAFGYHDGLVLLREEPPQNTLCPVCHETREDFSMPCEHCDGAD